MGLVYKGIPDKAATQMAQLYNCKNYVETGTLVGNSLKWAVDSHLFEKCIGIEIDAGYAGKTLAKVGLKAFVLLGDSLSHLPRLCKELDAPTFFWLDAHWSPDLSWDEPRVICPLVDELRIIVSRPFDDVIFIDDARMLGQEHWPSIVDLMNVLSGRYTMTVIDDYVQVLPRNKGTNL